MHYTYYSIMQHHILGYPLKIKDLAVSSQILYWGPHEPTPPPQIRFTSI